MTSPELSNEIPVALRLEFPVQFGFVSHFARILRSAGLDTKVGVPLPARGTALVELDLATPAMLSLEPEGGNVRLKLRGSQIPTVDLRIASIRYQTEDAISMGLASFCKTGKQKDPTPETVANITSIEGSLLNSIPSALRQTLEDRIGFVSQNELVLEAVIPAEDCPSAMSLLTGEQVWNPDVPSPLNDCLRGLLGFVSQNGPLSVELEIRPPLLTFKQGLDPAAALAGSDVRVAGFGQIVLHLPPSSEPVESCRTALALACSGETSFQQVFQVELGPDPSVHSLLLNLYGISEPAPQTEFANWVLTLRLPGRDLTSWFDCPPEKKIEFFYAYAPISRALQQTLRAWVPYLWFSDLERCADKLTSFSLLTFLSSRLYAIKDRTSFVDDVLRPGAAERLYSTVGARFATETKRIETRLLRAGRKDLAGPYQQKEVEEAMRMVKRNPRILLALIVLQANIFDFLIKLGLSGSKLKTQPGTSTFAEDFPDSMESRLRKVLGGFDCRPLTPPILMTASHAMSAAVRGAGGMEGQLVRQLPDGKRQISTRREISFAPETLFLQDNP